MGELKGQSQPATYAPAGSSRGEHGSDEMLEALGASGQTAYTYDLRGRLQSKTERWNGGPSVTLTCGYDADGNVTRRLKVNSAPNPRTQG